MFHVEQNKKRNRKTNHSSTWNNKEQTIKNNTMTLEEIKDSIRSIPDFPQKGILFRDLTTLFKNAEALREAEERLTKKYEGLGITKVAGIESRGFIMGAILANRLGAGFVPIRKKGKLPADTLEESYEKEYGTDTIEVHKDAFSSNDVVLIHDDLLATGGTMEAAVKLVKQSGVKKIFVDFLVALDDLNGADVIDEDVEVSSLMHY